MVSYRNILLAMVSISLFSLAATTTENLEQKTQSNEQF